MGRSQWACGQFVSRQHRASSRIIVSLVAWGRFCPCGPVAFVGYRVETPHAASDLYSFHRSSESASFTPWIIFVVHVSLCSTEMTRGMRGA